MVLTAVELLVRKPAVGVVVPADIPEGRLPAPGDDFEEDSEIARGLPLEDHAPRIALREVRRQVRLQLDPLAEVDVAAVVDLLQDRLRLFEHFRKIRHRYWCRVGKS